MTHICESAWLNNYGTCKECGGAVSHYICNAAMKALRNESGYGDLSYWIACDNTDCKNHKGEGVKGSARPDWEQRRT